MSEPRPLQARSSSDSNKRRNGEQAQEPKTKRQKTRTTKTKGVGAFHAAAFEALSTLKKNFAAAEKWQQVPRNDASNGTGMGPLVRRELSMKAATDMMFRGSNDRCAKACREQSVQGYHQSLKGRTSKTTQIVGGVKRYKFGPRPISASRATKSPWSTRPTTSRSKSATSCGWRGRWTERPAT